MHDYVIVVKIAAGFQKQSNRSATGTPTPSPSPNAPTIAVAERAADVIAGKQLLAA